MYFLEFFESFFGSFQFIFAATSFSFILKAYIFFILIRQTISLKKFDKPFTFLMVILISNMFSDFAWIIKLIQSIFMPELGYKVVLFFIRIAWIFFIIQYQTLALFLECLVDRNYKLSSRQWLFICVSFLFCLIFTLIALLDFDCNDRVSRFSMEPLLQNISTFYVLFPLILPSLFIAFQKIRLSELPHLLKKQLKVLV